MRYVFLNQLGRLLDVELPTSATPSTIQLRRSHSTEVVGGTISLTTIEWTKTFDRVRVVPFAIYLEQEP